MTTVVLKFGVGDRHGLAWRVACLAFILGLTAVSKAAAVFHGVGLLKDEGLLFCSGASVTHDLRF